MSRQEEQSRPDSCCSELCIRERWVGLMASTYWPAMDCCAVDGWSGQDTQLYPEAGKVPCISVSLISCRVKRKLHANTTRRLVSMHTQCRGHTKPSNRHMAQYAHHYTSTTISVWCHWHCVKQSLLQGNLCNVPLGAYHSRTGQIQTMPAVRI